MRALANSFADAWLQPFRSSRNSIVELQVQTPNHQSINPLQRRRQGLLLSPPVDNLHFEERSRALRFKIRFRSQCRTQATAEEALPNTAAVHIEFQCATQQLRRDKYSRLQKKSVSHQGPGSKKVELLCELEERLWTRGTKHSAAAKTRTKWQKKLMMRARY